MGLTFIHTADWQIGKPFGRLDAEKGAVLRRARLDVIDRIASRAREAGAGHILVAGDVFDAETLPDALIRQTLARLNGHADLAWHLISGNHDPARPGGIWDAVRALKPPTAVRLHLTPGAVEIAPGVHLLAAPLAAKSMTGDPTQWMDQAATPAHALRIGLAHGSVKGFGSLGEAAVPIDPARVASAGLAYLALGDWHGAKEIGPRVWYAGTPEPDSFTDNDPGHVLAVTLESAAAAPRIARQATAEFRWLDRRVTVAAPSDLDSLAAEIGRLGHGAARTLLALTLDGRIGLGDLGGLEARLEALAGPLFELRLDRRQLATATSSGDIAALGDGAIKAVAERLAARAGDPAAADARIARLALERLAMLAAAAAEPDGEPR